MELIKRFKEWSQKKDPRGTPPWKAIIFQHRLPLMYKERPIFRFSWKIRHKIIPNIIRNLENSKDAKTKKGTVHVVTSADNNFAIPLTVMLKSLVMNFKIYSNLIIYILDGGITDENKEKIIKSLDPNKIDIKWIKIDESKLKDVKISAHISIATYYRLLIHKLLPNNIDKVVYIDSDTIFNEDISKIWELNIKNAPLLAVQDQDANTRFVSSPYGLSNYRDLGLDSKSKYFNAGVLLINLKKWRSDDIGSKSIEYARKNAKIIKFHDQDGLNAILSNKWKELDLRWNFSSQMFWRSTYINNVVCDKKTYEKIICNPYIIHFTTGLKPWNRYCNHPYKKLWYYYLDMTSWKGRKQK